MAVAKREAAAMEAAEFAAHAAALAAEEAAAVEAAEAEAQAAANEARAAARLQSIFRGKSAKSWYHTMLQAKMEARSQELAAVRMQAMARSKLAKDEVRARAEAKAKAEAEAKAAAIAADIAATATAAIAATAAAIAAIESPTRPTVLLEPSGGDDSTSREDILLMARVADALDNELASAHNVDTSPLPRCVHRPLSFDDASGGDVASIAAVGAQLDEFSQMKRKLEDGAANTIRHAWRLKKLRMFTKIQEDTVKAAAALYASHERASESRHWRQICELSKANLFCVALNGHVADATNVANSAANGLADGLSTPGADRASRTAGRVYTSPSKKDFEAALAESSGHPSDDEQDAGSADHAIGALERLYMPPGITPMALPPQASLSMSPEVRTLNFEVPPTADVLAAATRTLSAAAVLSWDQEEGQQAVADDEEDEASAEILPGPGLVPAKASVRNDHSMARDTAAGPQLTAMDVVEVQKRRIGNPGSPRDRRLHSVRQDSDALALAPAAASEATLAEPSFNSLDSAKPLPQPSPPPSPRTQPLVASATQGMVERMIESAISRALDTPPPKPPSAVDAPENDEDETQGTLSDTRPPSGWGSIAKPPDPAPDLSLLSPRSIRAVLRHGGLGGVRRAALVQHLVEAQMARSSSAGGGSHPTGSIRFCASGRSQVDAGGSAGGGDGGSSQVRSSNGARAGSADGSRSSAGASGRGGQRSTSASGGARGALLPGMRSFPCSDAAAALFHGPPASMTGSVAEAEAAARRACMSAGLPSNISQYLPQPGPTVDGGEGGVGDANRVTHGDSGGGDFYGFNQVSCGSGVYSGYGAGEVLHDEGCGSGGVGPLCGSSGEGGSRGGGGGGGGGRAEAGGTSGGGRRGAPLLTPSSFFVPDPFTWSANGLLDTNGNPAGREVRADGHNLQSSSLAGARAASARARRNAPSVLSPPGSARSRPATAVGGSSRRRGGSARPIRPRSSSVRPHSGKPHHIAPLVGMLHQLHPDLPVLRPPPLSYPGVSTGATNGPAYLDMEQWEGDANGNLHDSHARPPVSGMPHASKPPQSTPPPMPPPMPRPASTFDHSLTLLPQHAGRDVERALRKLELYEASKKQRQEARRQLKARRSPPGSAHARRDGGRRSPVRHLLGPPAEDEWPPKLSRTTDRPPSHGPTESVVRAERSPTTALPRASMDADAASQVQGPTPVQQATREAGLHLQVANLMEMGLNATRRRRATSARSKRAPRRGGAAAASLNATIGPLPREMMQLPYLNGVQHRWS